MRPACGTGRIGLDARTQSANPVNSGVDQDTSAKRAAGRAAADEIVSGSRIGLGTGSTVQPFLERLAERLWKGELQGIAGVPTSHRTEREAMRLEIPLCSLENAYPLDIAVDGADEVDPSGNLIKGLGGALLREKVVAQSAKRFVVVADASKRVAGLGEKAPLPIEVCPFAWSVHVSWLREMGCVPTRREDRDGEPYVTDNGNFIVDCAFPRGIADPPALEGELRAHAGIVESGLFLGMASEAYVGTGTGVLRDRFS